MGEPRLAPLFTLRAELNPSIDGTDGGPLGRRTFNSVATGTVEGSRLRGELVPGVGDWMLTRRDGVNVVDARVVVRTADGAVIHMSYGGRIRVPEEILGEVRDPDRRHLVDPARYYFRTNPVFETAAPQYAWLNDIVAIGSGRLLQGRGVAYDVFEVL
jgi:hypothetical protein